MKKIKFILSSIVITLCSVFMLIGGVNAEEINSVTFNTKHAIVGDQIFTGGTIEDSNVTAEISKWYTGGTTEDPSYEIPSTGKFKKKNNYTVEVKFTPAAGDNFNDESSFYISFDDADEFSGYVADIDKVTGIATVNFEVPLYYTLTFDTQGGSEVSTEYVEVKELYDEYEDIPEPEEPTKNGYVFYGWYNTSECEPYDTFSFKNILEENTTVYALFVPTNKIINNVNVTLTLPKAGTKFNVKNEKDEYGDIWEVQSPKLNVKTNTANTEIYDSVILKDIKNYDYFSGTIKNGEIYNFGIALSSTNNYYFAKTGLTFTVNGKKYTNLEAHENTLVGVIHKNLIGNKKNNTMKVTVKNKAVKSKKIKNKSKKISAIIVKKAQGVVTFTKTKGNKNFTVDKKTGKITIKKGTKIGTYTIKVKVTANGNENHKALNKNIKVKITIK